MVRAAVSWRTKGGANEIAEVATCKKKKKKKETGALRLYTAGRTVSEFNEIQPKFNVIQPKFNVIQDFHMSTCV